MNPPATRNWSFRSAIALLLGCASLLTQAAPVHWDEAIDGDLEPHLSPFEFTVGVHTFTGTMSAFFPGQPNDLDSFLFDVPDGLSLISVGFAFDNVQHSATTISMNAEYAISSPTVTTFYTPTQTLALYFPAGDTAVSPVNLFETALPLGAGMYRLLPGISGSDPGLEFSLAYDYTLSFTVVPVPPALLLFAPGMIVIAVCSRRRIVT